MFGLGVVILQGCSQLYSTYASFQSCTTEYPYVSLMGHYDLTGHSDSYFQFVCPTILSYGTLKIEGSDKKKDINIVEPKYQDDLPF